MSAEKKDQIDKKFFFEITNVLDQMIKSTSILLKNFFLKKIQFGSFFQYSPILQLEYSFPNSTENLKTNIYSILLFVYFN